uniref:EGF-like domain-containing protein n=1 Tax=Timema shepardi TaxID=629360 RepID=A0A7R9FVI7_TIMSH|nr:unnamed protein product [Timema shepardi]
MLIHSYGGIGFGIKREIFFLNLEDGYFGCQVNESTDVLQLYELSKLCDGTSDCFMASDELTKELKCTTKDLWQAVHVTSCSRGHCPLLLKGPFETRGTKFVFPIRASLPSTSASEDMCRPELHFGRPERQKNRDAFMCFIFATSCLVESSQLKPNKSWFSKCTVWQLKICSQRDLTSLDQFIVQSENNVLMQSHVENVPGDVHNNPQTLVLECLQPPYTRVRQVASSATRMNRPEQPLVLCQSVPHGRGATDRVLDVINKWLKPNKLTYYWMRKDNFTPVSSTGRQTNLFTLSITFLSTNHLIILYNVRVSNLTLASKRQTEGIGLKLLYQSSKIKNHNLETKITQTSCIGAPWCQSGVLNAQLALPVEHPPLRRESVGPNLSRRMNPSAHHTSLPCGGVPPEETATNRKSLLRQADCDKEDGVKCQNGACLDSQCHCNDGFGGCSCEVPDENECKYRPCDVFAHCTNTLGSFHCTCFPGYMGDGFACEDHVRFTSKRSTKRGPVVCSLTHFKRTERARGTGEVGSHLYGNQSKVHPLAPILPHTPLFLTVPLNLLTPLRPPTTIDARSYRQIAYVSLRRRAEMSMAFINRRALNVFNVDEWYLTTLTNIQRRKDFFVQCDRLIKGAKKEQVNKVRKKGEEDRFAHSMEQTNQPYKQTVYAGGGGLTVLVIVKCVGMREYHKKRRRWLYQRSLQAYKLDCWRTGRRTSLN